MGKKEKQRGFRSLQTKISRPVFFWMLLVLCISYLSLYIFVFGRIYRQNYRACETQMAQTEVYIREKINNVIEKLYYIRANDAFEQCLSQILFEEDWKNEGAFLGEIANVLAFHKSTEPWISTIYFYTPKGSYSDMTVLTNSGYRFEESELFSVFEKESSSIVWGKFYQDPIFITKQSVVPVIYKFYVTGYSQPVGLLANLEQTRIYDYLKSMELPDNAYVALVSADGTQIADTLPTAYQWVLEGEDSILSSLGGEEGIRRMRNGRCHVIAGFRKISNAPWYVVYVCPENIKEQIGYFTAAFLMIGMMAIFAIYLCVKRIVRRVTEPVVDLARVMEREGKDRYQVEVSYPEQDELRILTDSFNQMIRYTRQLFESQERYIEQLKEEKEKVRVEQLLKRRAEIMALQAQINPHFLYNTLDSIRWKAEELDAEEISSMVQALANLFRIDLSRGREMIPVSQELVHVTSYLSIQKYRYGEKMDYNVEVSQEIRNAYVPKIILQPLVENAIYHGIREKEGKGMIWIRGWKEEDRVILETEDDGVGIPEEKLERLKEGLKKGLIINKEGYGIFNVNERIRLYFGETYGLEIDNREGGGTRVRMLMPEVEEDEVERYVPYFDSRR